MPERLHGGCRRGRSPRRPRGPFRSLSYAHLIAPIHNDVASRLTSFPVGRGRACVRAWAETAGLGLATKTRSCLIAAPASVLGQLAVMGDLNPRRVALHALSSSAAGGPDLFGRVWSRLSRALGNPHRGTPLNLPRMKPQMRTGRKPGCSPPP